jgi:hypothetical protein
MEANALKSWILIWLCHKLYTPPVFLLCGIPVPVQTQCVYLGVTLSTATNNMFEEHYTTKAARSRSIANVAFCVEAHTGALPPWAALKLYKSRIDPHLSSACEVSLDTGNVLAKLEKVQVAYLRRVLGVNPRSSWVTLFTETGIWPLKYCRILLALHFLKHMVGLSHNRYLWHGLVDSYNLSLLNKRDCWYSQLRRMLKMVSDMVPAHYADYSLFLPDLPLLDYKYVESLEQQLEKCMNHILQVRFDSDARTNLIRARKETDQDGKIFSPTLYFRHYLSVPYQKHRKALVNLVLSDHCLAVEVHRRRSRSYYIACEFRLCRFCLVHVEDEAHALFECRYSPLCEMRIHFLDACAKVTPEIYSKFTAMLPSQPGAFLKYTLTTRKLVKPLAHYAYEVLKLYASSAIYTAGRLLETDLAIM